MTAFERVGYAVDRMSSLALLTDLDVKSGRGDVILNITCVPESRLEDVRNLLGIVLNSPYTMSNRIVVRRSGEALGSLRVPEHMAAIGTVCSITLNGILLKAGIRVWPKFGGIVEVIDNVATRFLSTIDYEGSSFTPLEIFMKSGTTDILGVLTCGTGRALGGFREIPEGSLREAKKVVREIENAGIRPGILFGEPGGSLLGVPVTPGMAGIVVLGGLNPIAALVEAKIAEETLAVAALYDYAMMSPLKSRLESRYPFSRFAAVGFADNLRGLRSGYWSVFEGSKQITL